MNILICAINSRFTHSSLAIRYLRNSILKSFQNNDVTLMEFFINQNYLEIFRSIFIHKPEILMLSVQIWNVHIIESLLVDISATLPECKIILGGPEISFNASEWINKFMQISLIICGPGENAIENLAKNSFDLEKCYNDNKIIQADIVSFDNIDFPYIEKDFETLKNRYIYFESTRGCPFSCSYCLSSRNDIPLSFKSIEKTNFELSILLKQKPILIKFVDRTFNAIPSRARAIWKYLVEQSNQFPTTRYHFEIHPSLLEEEDFLFLATIPKGLFQFEIGIQSVNLGPLTTINRPCNWDNAKIAVKRLLQIQKIHIHLDLIAGLPGEGLNEIAKTFDEIIFLNPDHFQLGFLKGLYGTKLREEAACYDMVFMHKPPYEILKNNKLSVFDLSLLHNIEELVENIFNQHECYDILSSAFNKLISPFTTFVSINNFYKKHNFDIRTRQTSKLREILLLWLQSEIT